MPQLLVSLEAAGASAGAADDADSSLATDVALRALAADVTGRGAPGGPVDTDSLDWGTVAVFTCSASCAAPALPEGGSGAEGDGSSSSAYAVEWCWHQEISP